jgi:uncharacterized protein (DUF488 family)
MFYRRKVIFAILEAFANTLDKRSLQKLLFLFSQQQSIKSYDFIPYKFGCFSPSANADLIAMQSQAQINIDEQNIYNISTATNYSQSLKKTDIEILNWLKDNFANCTANDLIKYTYIQYPYWACKSQIADQVLSKLELKKVQEATPQNQETVLFTIGYEGISFEEYLNRLIRYDVKMLVDVRANAMSMKYGFSKKTLENICEGIGITYIHIPEVGIQSNQRQTLFTQNDYDNLFLIYKSQNLCNTVAQQQQILKLLQENKRVALTCFEANICQCHRKPLADAIANLPDFSYTVQHI